MVQARELLEQLKQFVQQNGITTRDTHIIKTECSLLFQEGHFQQVLDTISAEAAGIESRNLDMLELKSQQSLGDNNAIKTWLEEHQHYRSDDNNMMRMYWLDFENYYLEANGTTEEVIESYKQRLDLSRLMGNDSLTASLLLKQGYQYLRQGRTEQAENNLNQLRTLNLDWWQFNLFEALLLNAKQDQSATEFAQKAKTQAGPLWQPRHENALMDINNEANAAANTPLLF